MVETLLQGGLAALEHALPGWPDEIQHQVRRAWAHPPHRVDDATVDDVLARIRVKAGRRRRNAIIGHLRDAEARDDQEAAARLTAQLRELARERQGS